MAPWSNLLFCSQDLEIVYSYLHGMEALSNLREHQLRSVFMHVIYLKYDITSTSSRKAGPNDGENHFLCVHKVKFEIEFCCLTDPFF